MASKNELNRLEIRDKTLLVAKDFIINNGVKALTARKLAQENGYSVGTLYNLFGSIDEIVVTVAINHLTELCEKITSSLNEIDDAHIKLQHFANYLYNFINENPNLSRLVLADITNYCEELPLEYTTQMNQLFMPVNDVFKIIFPAIDSVASKKLSEVYQASIMGIMSLSAKNLLESVCLDNPVAISELLFTIYLAGMKKLNSKSE